MNLQELRQQQEYLTRLLCEYIGALDDLESNDQESLEALTQYLEAWETSSTALDAKINAYCHAISKMQNEAKYLREVSARYAALAKQKESKLDVLKSRLIAFVVTQGGRYKTCEFNLRMQKSPPKVLLDDSWQGDIPDAFIKEQRLSDYADKSAIKAALLKGQSLPFATLEQSEHIRGL